MSSTDLRVAFRAGSAQEAAARFEELRALLQWLEGNPARADRRIITDIRFLGTRVVAALMASGGAEADRLATQVDVLLQEFCDAWQRLLRGRLDGAAFAAWRNGEIPPPIRWLRAEIFELLGPIENVLKAMLRDGREEIEREQAVLRELMQRDPIAGSVIELLVRAEAYEMERLRTMLVEHASLDEPSRRPDLETIRALKEIVQRRASLNGLTLSSQSLLDACRTSLEPAAGE